MMSIHKRLAFTLILVAAPSLLLFAWLFSGNQHIEKDNTAAESNIAAKVFAQESNNPLSNSAQARAYRQREVFESNLRAFLLKAKQMPPDERNRQAAKWQQQIDYYEKLKQLSAGEAYLLKTAMMKATILDEQAQQAVLIDLTARYKADTERREAAWLAHQQQNPQFQAYKSRESEIVADVMAMTQIPGQLTRDEYLRQRLQQERERVYP